MKSIVAVDKHWGIGKNNDLLFDLPTDMKFFRDMTLNKVIVMGSNTLKSFPGGNPLKNRINIVLYPNGEKRSDCIIVESLEELRQELKKYDSDDIFIVGGAMFYKTMLPYCNTAYITKVDADGKADVFYENLDKMPNWQCTDSTDNIQENGLVFRFTTYKNNDVQIF
ncbi:MAG: dihydrofolate reductase [Clostridiales bacterium]|nr:dihydrofolate reductase [Clostridiales bacterium]